MSDILDDYDGVLEDDEDVEDDEDLILEEEQFGSESDGIDKDELPKEDNKK